MGRVYTLSAILSIIGAYGLVKNSMTGLSAAIGFFILNTISLATLTVNFS